MRTELVVAAEVGSTGEGVMLRVKRTIKRRGSWKTRRFMAVWLSIMDSEQMAKVKDFKSERRPAKCSVSHFSMLSLAFSPSCGHMN